MTGSICISVDFELIWGVHDKEHEHYLESLRKERQIVKRLLILFKKYEVPATWATVGHLFLDSCNQAKEKHPELVHPEFSWHKDWFSGDPGTAFKQAPLWYAPDLIKAIKATPKQEIGSHSFSHIIFGDKGCSAAVAESDIKACMAAAKKKGVKLHSFVFPRNSEGHKDLLVKHGFIAYRGKDEYWFKNYNTLYKPLLLLDYLLLRTPPTRKPTIESSGLVNIPGSMQIISRHGMRKLLPLSWQVTKAKRGIRRALATDTVFHLWFHPLNFGEQTDEVFTALEEVLQYAKEKGIQFKTMEQIAHDTLNKKSKSSR